jgi:magnesium-transporting ATPase (P-type)
MQWRSYTWAELRVSDLIRIENGDTFPADTLILNASTSAQEDGRAYVQTTSLDGETNLKMKLSCLPVALKSLTHQSDAKDAAKELERYVVKCLAPNADVRISLLLFQQHMSRFNVSCSVGPRLHWHFVRTCCKRRESSDER